MKANFLVGGSDLFTFFSYPANSLGECLLHNCGNWNFFIKTTLRDAVRSGKEVERIHLGTTSDPSADLASEVKTCTGINATRIVNMLLQNDPVNFDSSTEFECNGDLWRVGSCGHKFPSVCVNCTNPCTDTGSDDTLNCVDTASLKVFAIDFIPPTDCDLRQIMEKYFLSTHSDKSSFTQYPENSEGDCLRINKFNAWNSFINGKVRDELNDEHRRVTGVTISTSAATTGDLNVEAKTCSGSVAGDIMQTLTDTEPFNNNLYKAYICNGDDWKVGRCGNDGCPSICVNCYNPCTDVGSNDTLNCIDTDSMTVLVVDFEDVFEKHNNEGNFLGMSVVASSFALVAFVLSFVVAVSYLIYKYKQGNDDMNGDLIMI